MELDEYKLRMYQHFTGPVMEKSLNDLKIIMQTKAGSVIEKIRQNLQLEMLFALFFVGFIVYLFFRYQGTYLQILAFGTLCFCLVFIFYLGILYKKISRYYLSSSSIKENIEQLIAIIRKFIKLYFQITMVFLPVTFVLVFLAVMLDQTYLFAAVSALKVLVYAGAASAWYIMMYYFTKWYLHTLYGYHLKELNLQLKEMQETSEGL